MKKVFLRKGFIKRKNDDYLISLPLEAIHNAYKLLSKANVVQATVITPSNKKNMSCPFVSPA